MKFRVLILLLILLNVMLNSCTSGHAVIQIVNPLNASRDDEVIEIARELIESQLKTDEMDNLQASCDDQLLPHQLLDLDGDGSWEKMLVMVSLQARTRKEITINRAETLQPEVKSYVFGRIVPERMDDFAWENDRIAFRMYGPALERTGEISSGVDVWTKSVEYAIIDKWYAAKNYHSDHGEGADFYKVGSSRGCGGIALMDGDSTYTSANFRDYRLLADGPLRIVFELDYGRWGPDDLQIKETKRITLDAGLHFNLITSKFDLSRPLKAGESFVAGLSSHPGHSGNEVQMRAANNHISVYESLKPGQGELGTAILWENGTEDQRVIPSGDQYLITLPLSSAGEVSYYAGAGWSMSPWLRSEQDWLQLVESFESHIRNPIETSAKNP